jgi:hypothetical protein
MGGREWGRSRVRPRDCDRWFLNRRGALEEPSPRSRKRASRGRDRRPGKAIVKERNIRSCTLGFLFTRTVLEEPFTAGERTSRRGLIRGPEKASVKGGNSQPCALGFLFTQTALEEPFTTAERFALGLDVGDQGRPPPWEGPGDEGHWNFCSQETVLEEPSWKSEGRGRV